MYCDGFILKLASSTCTRNGLKRILYVHGCGRDGLFMEVALGAVFLAGILFVIMSVTPLRKWMLESIPLNLRIAMGSGVGLFIGFIGLKSGGIIIANEATFCKLG